MFLLIRSAVNGDKLTHDHLKLYSEELLPELYTLSKRHEIANLVALGLQINSLISPKSEFYSKFYTEISSAIVNYQRQKYEFEKLCEFFEDSEIPYVPLKGSVMRGLYPEPWMRTSCDIDILVHESHLQKCVEKYSEISTFSAPPIKDNHHIFVSTKSGVNLEFHYDLAEQSRAKFASKVLNDVWRYVFLKQGSNYRYEMNADMFVFYHFAHMAKHFEVGGCGVRPLLDVYLIGKNIQISSIINSEFFEKSGLKQFAEAVIRLSNVWFGEQKHTEATKRLESFLLTGGVFGTYKNQVCLQQHKKGGKLEYMISRIFLPHNSLKNLYPILEKHKWLMPIMQVARWFRVLFIGRFKRSVNELKYSSSITDEQSESMRKMLDDLGL